MRYILSLAALAFFLLIPGCVAPEVAMLETCQQKNAELARERDSLKNLMDTTRIQTGEQIKILVGTAAATHQQVKAQKTELEERVNSLSVQVDDLKAILAQQVEEKKD